MTRVTRQLLPISALLTLLTFVALPLLLTACTSEEETQPPPTTPPPTASPIPTLTPTPPQEPTDRDALVALYEATDGPNWRNNTNWLTNKPLNEWFGVTANSIDRVILLDLNRNGLNGEIPSEFGSLLQLEALDLSENALTGKIPPAIGELSNLRSLSLSYNWLTGRIPPELRNLSRIETLLLDSNQLTGPVPSELGGLLHLERLLLSNNQLGGSIPPELGSLSSLKQLYLDDNNLGYIIPAELGNLSNLKWLNLEGNRLTGRIPPTLGDITSLETLRIQWNRLIGEIPPELGNLLNLQLLDLNHNKLSGEIPPDLGRLTKLEVLNLSSNRLTGQFPPELAYLSRLQELYLKGSVFWENLYTGCVPERLWPIPLHDLSTLNLPSCPADLSEATKPNLQSASDRDALVALYEATDGPNWEISTNWLSDKPLRQWFGVTTDTNGRVTQLSLGYNRLNGHIPPELGNLTNLNSPVNSNNQLSEHPSPAFTELPGMQAIYLYGNQLSGCLPANLLNAEMNDLSHLSLQLCEPIHETQAGEREILVALYNSTDGPNWKNSTNWLSAKPLDEWYGVTTNIMGFVTELSLRGNGLSGKLPTELNGLRYVKRIYVNENELRGCIPLGISSVGGAFPLALVHPNNHLLYCRDDEGPISLKSQALLALYQSTVGFNWNNNTNWLSDNPLGDWFGITTDSNDHIIEIRLGENGLSGEIPPELATLPNLETLYLGGNSLTGCIPLDPASAPAGDVAALGLPFCQITQDPQAAEKAALVALYEATDGPNWTNNTNWLTDLPLAEWHGVTTNTNGRVSEIILSDSNLSGILPPELGILSELLELVLDRNQLSGEIPPELGDLSNLEVLDLAHNQLTGDIPAQLAILNKLTKLLLEVNLLSGVIPPELGNLSNLANLNLAANLLTGEVPTELGNLSNLVKLRLKNNQLTGKIPASLGSLPNLETLIMSENQLTGEIPPELGNLNNLKFVWLDRNQISGKIPPELGNLSNLVYLSLYDNLLIGEIPTELGNLSKLALLYLHNNRLIGEIPTELSFLKELDSLHLGANQLTGCIPETLLSIESNDLSKLALPLCP